MVLRSTGQVSCRMPFTWDSSDVFIMIMLRLMVWGRKNTEVTYLYHLSIRTHIINMSYHCLFYPDQLAKIVLVSFLSWKGTLLLPFKLYFWENVTIDSSHLRSCSFILLPWGQNNNIDYLKFLCREYTSGLSIFIFVCIHAILYQYRLLGVYFIPGAINHHFFILWFNLSPPCPTWAFLVGSCLFDTYSL